MYYLQDINLYIIFFILRKENCKIKIAKKVVLPGSPGEVKYGGCCFWSCLMQRGRSSYSWVFFSCGDLFMGAVFHEVFK